MRPRTRAQVLIRVCIPASRTGVKRDLRDRRATQRAGLAVSLPPVSETEPLIRRPQQRRSQESLERVLNAGAELLREKGYEGFTVQEVSRRANVSIGSIYARADSKERLFSAIYEREMERMNLESLSLQDTARREDVAGRELVVALVQELADNVLGNAATLRVFMHRAVVDRDLWKRGSAGLRHLSRTFESALLEHRDELAHPNPELAIDIAFRFVYDTLARRISHGAKFESDRDLSDEELVRELARAAADYLMGPEPAPKGPRGKARSKK
jgi:AcrR family transcriptional regulator